VQIMKNVLIAGSVASVVDNEEIHWVQHPHGPSLARPRFVLCCKLPVTTDSVIVSIPEGQMGQCVAIATMTLLHMTPTFCLTCFFMHKVSKCSFIL